MPEMVWFVSYVLAAILFVRGTLPLMSQARNESGPSFEAVDSDIVFMCRPDLSQAEQLAQGDA